MDPDVYSRTLDCLDTLTHRPANQIACMVWPYLELSSPGSAGARIKPILAELARRGLALRSSHGWFRLETVDDDRNSPKPMSQKR